MNPIQAQRPRILIVAAVLLLGVVTTPAFFLLGRNGPCRAPVVSHSAAPSPSGYQPMSFHDVSPTRGGYAVRLVDGAREKQLTIYVGQSEGYAISLRSEGQKFPRPLTADLLESVMRELGGELDHVQVDALRYNTFHGSLHLRQAGRDLTIDARPSDAIALAIGRGAPILVADRVIADAAQDLE